MHLVWNFLASLSAILSLCCSETSHKIKESSVILHTCLHPKGDYLVKEGETES